MSDSDQLNMFHWTQVVIFVTGFLDVTCMICSFYGFNYFIQIEMPKWEFEFAEKLVNRMPILKQYWFILNFFGCVTLLTSGLTLSWLTWFSLHNGNLYKWSFLWWCMTGLYVLLLSITVNFFQKKFLPIILAIVIRFALIIVVYFCTKEWEKILMTEILHDPFL